MLATEAGIDVVRAVTLSEESVKSLSQQSASFSDKRNVVAPQGSKYERRLQRLLGSNLDVDGFVFNFKVYVDPKVNAFAMGDGTVRVYSGLMDMMDDNELRFVIGHEIGHVLKQHVRKKMRLAYLGSALRKGIAAQNNEVGQMARSQLGGFVEKLVNAQFSQQEERDADDSGLGFLLARDFPAESSITALKKLASQGNEHSFLASHPAPGKRADRLAKKINAAATDH